MCAPLPDIYYFVCPTISLMKHMKKKDFRMSVSKDIFGQWQYNQSVLFILLCLSLLSCGQEETPDNRQWYKGNLHTHSWWSDGNEYPEVIMDWYKSRGYDFVALTDHNTLAEGEKWKKIPSDSIFQEAFQRYLTAYGEEWVEYRKDSLGALEVKLKTLAEYRSLFESKEEFLILQAEEITDHFGNKPLHMNATNIAEKINPAGGNSVAEILQNNIDAVIRQRDETGRPMIPHINHPNFGFAISLEDMVALENERFFEVYNGHPLVHNTGDSAHISTEEMWDRINMAYLREGKPLMYGLATDDTHNYHRQGRQWKKEWNIRSFLPGQGRIPISQRSYYGLKVPWAVSISRRISCLFAVKSGLLSLIPIQSRI